MLTAQEDTPLLLDLLSNDVDPDGTALQITEIDGQPIAPRGSVAVVNGTVVMDPDGSVRFLPDPNVSGPTSFTYTVSDPTGLTSTAIAQLTITPVPDAPEPIDDVITIDEDGAAPLSLIANDTDPDGEPLTLTGIEGTPVEPGDTVIVDNGTVTVGDNGQVTFIPDPNFSGQANFSYTVADPTGASATAQVTVNVTPINDPPVAQPDTVTGLIGQPVTFDPTRNDNDVDADPLRISQIAGQPIAPGQTITIPEGTVTLQPDGRVVFNPFDPEQRQFELTYVVTDPSGLSSPATVSIVVQELGYPHEQEREDDVNRVEYDPLSLALPLARNGEYDPVFISPAVRISQQQTGNVDFSAFTSVHSTTNDVFAWNHSTNLDTRYGSHYINFAYVRSDDPMARDISDLICSQFDQNTNLVCWPQIRPESVANMQYILLDERIDKDTKKPDPNWRPAEIKPEAISRQSVSDLFPLSADKVSDKPAGFSDFTAQIESMTNKSFARDAKAVDADALEDLEPEPELENQ